jgi:hypothetical protein
VSEPRVPAAIEVLIRTVAGGSTEEDRDRRASTFARGLAMGALVGAAIAGSTIWQRRHSERVGGDPVAPGLAGGSPGAERPEEPQADGGR